MEIFIGWYCEQCGFKVFSTISADSPWVLLGELCPRGFTPKAQTDLDKLTAAGCVPGCVHRWPAALDLLGAAATATPIVEECASWLN